MTVSDASFFHCFRCVERAKNPIILLGFDFTNTLYKNEIKEISNVENLPGFFSGGLPGLSKKH